MNKDIREALFKSLWRKRGLKIVENIEKHDSNISRKEK